MQLLVQVAAAETQAKELQAELTSTYREKAKLAEDLVAASRQLQVVRDTNEAQARELADAAAKLREARGRVKDMSDVLDKERAARALAASELEVPPRRTP